MLLMEGKKGVIKAFYLMNGSISIFSEEFVDINVDQQLIGGMLSALDTFSSELTGSNIKTFSSSNAMVYIKFLPNHYKFVVFADLNINQSELNPLLNDITSLLENMDFFTSHDISRILNHDEKTSILITNKVKQFNFEFTLKSKQRKRIQTQGKIKFLIKLFGNDVIKIWEALLTGKRIIITGISEEKTTAILNSLLLLHLKDNFYHILYNIETKDIDQIENQKHYIASTNSSFILMMRKDLWDVHIDADKSKINNQAGDRDIDKFKLILFSGLISLAEFADSKEEDLRNCILGINSSVLTMRNLVTSSESTIKSMLKKHKIPVTFYDSVLSQIKL